jgi:hypothetical protein
MRFGGYQLLVTVDAGYNSGKLKNKIVVDMQRSGLPRRYPRRCYGQVQEQRFRCNPVYPTKTVNGVWELTRTTTIQDITNFVQDYASKYGRGSPPVCLQCDLTNQFPAAIRRGITHSSRI